MKSQEPFYEGSGSLLNMRFKLAGCEKADTFVTNAVHRHPRGNRPSRNHEIVNCSSYLYRGLEIVCPRLVIGLGDDAERVLSFCYPTVRKVPWPFITPTNVRSKTVPCLHFAKHPSWVKRQHNDALEKAYVDSFADALKWAIAKGSPWSQDFAIRDAGVEANSTVTEGIRCNGICESARHQTAFDATRPSASRLNRRLERCKMSDSISTRSRQVCHRINVGFQESPSSATAALVYLSTTASAV